VQVGGGAPSWPSALLGAADRVGDDHPTEFVPETAPVDALVSSDAFAVVSEPTLSSLSIAALAVDSKVVNIQELKKFKVCQVR
jgi:hypothetical protein